jgi:hypothetical protein
MRQTIYLILLLGSWCYANVTSGTGTVNFDVNADGTTEAKLNSTGLAIGPGLTPAANLHVGGNAIVSGTLAIGSSSQDLHTLNINGSWGFSSGSFVADGDIEANSLAFANSTSGKVTLTLPQASQVGDGRMYRIKKVVTANEVDIKGGGAIDGQSTIRLSSGNMGYLNVISLSGNWSILSISANTAAPFEPSEVSAVVAWYDASDSSTLWQDSAGTTPIVASAGVGKWDDKSGNGNHATQGTSSREPTYNSSDTRLNNHPSIGYDNAWKFLQTASLTMKRIYVITYYDDPNNAFDDYHLLFGNDGNSIVAQGQHSNNYWRQSNVLNRDFWKNGDNTTPFNGAVGGTDAILPMPACIWRWDWNASYTDNWDIMGKTTKSHQYWQYGAVGEIILTDGTETADEQSKIEGYLAHKWGISLASGHTYENIEP